MKMKRYINKDSPSSDEEENTTTRVPFWNINCTKLFKRLAFGIRGTIIKIEQKEWYPSSKMLTWGSWFNCNIYKMDIKRKYTAGDLVCTTWKHVTHAIKIENRRS
jgi:hypothetical protein